MSATGVQLPFMNESTANAVDSGAAASYGRCVRVMNTEIDVKLLGALEVALPGGHVEFEGAKQRRLFVALALGAPEAVTVDALVEAVWGDQAPDGRDQALQKQVSRLRARLGDRLPVRRRAAGYALEIEREAIDSRRFEALLEGARAERDPGRLAEQLGAALALWRGAALADHRFDEFAQSEIGRLEELRLEATEERLAADLARGQAADVVGDAARAGGRASPARAAARAADARALPGRAGRRRRSRRCAKAAGSSSRSSGSSRGPSCAGWSG